MSHTHTLPGFTVIADGEGGQRLTAKIEQGKNLFVGASNHCGLQLCGDDVSSLQCLFMLEGDAVSVQDWASKSGTFVNGEPITTKVELGEGDEVRIATYRIRVSSASKNIDLDKAETPPSVPEPQPEALAASPLSVAAGGVPGVAVGVPGVAVGVPGVTVGVPGVTVGVPGVESDAPEPLATFDAADAGHTEPNRPIDEASDREAGISAWSDEEVPPSLTSDPEPEPQGEGFQDPDLAPTGDVSAAEESESFPDHTAAGSGDDSFRFDDDLFEADSFDQETMQLMRAEIEDLQAALAQRDEQITSLVSDREAGSGDPAARDELEHQAETMLSRLQELLDEAECHDERVAVLQELLQTAEEANQAEQEERAQLEAWVGDIERRIGQREEEWNAETAALRTQLDQARDERDRVQHQLREAASQGSAPTAYQETLERLQQQNQSLQQTLDSRGKEIASLQQRLERAENREEETFRDERAVVARERAEVSRLRHELQQQLTDSEALPEAKDQPDREFANRLKTLREHLKEIHEEEKQEREQRGGTALASRIGRLWKRLEY